MREEDRTSKAPFRGRAERGPNPEEAAFGAVPSVTSQKPDYGSGEPEQTGPHTVEGRNGMCQPQRVVAPGCRAPPRSAW